MRILPIAVLLLVSSACSTLATVHGARTLEPGQLQVSTAVSAQRGGSPVSYAGIPIPQLELVTRYGIARDLDMGARLYAVGTAFDMRYRFHHEGPLHLAVDPTFASTWIPGTGQGSFEAHAPVLAEVELAEWVSISGGPRLVLRDQWNTIDDPDLGKGAASRLDAFAGAGGRLELHPWLFSIGLSGDVYAQPARHAGPAWSLGIDLGMRTPAVGRSAP